MLLLLWHEKKREGTKHDKRCYDWHRERSTLFAHIRPQALQRDLGPAGPRRIAGVSLELMPQFWQLAKQANISNYMEGATFCIWNWCNTICTYTSQTVDSWQTWQPTHWVSLKWSSSPLAGEPQATEEQAPSPKSDLPANWPLRRFILKVLKSLCNVWNKIIYNKNSAEIFWMQNMVIQCPWQINLGRVPSGEWWGAAIG